MSGSPDKGQRPHLFLERQSYRRRRWADAARLLPMLGLVLWMVPLLWLASERTGPSIAVMVIYIFAVWLALVLMSATISIRISIPEDDRSDPSEREEGS